MNCLQQSDAEEVAWFATDAHEPVQYEVHFYLPTDGNLSLDGLASTNDVREIQAYKARLTSRLLRCGLRSAYVPNVFPMSGLVGTLSDFANIIDLPSGIRLAWAAEPFEGLALPRHHAFLNTPGGCATVVLTSRTMSGDPLCVTAHVGLDSAIDRTLIHECAASRAEFSIIDAMVSYAQARGCRTAGMTLRIFGAIPWQAFRYSSDDVVYGEKNFMLLAFLENWYGKDAAFFMRLSDDFHEHLCLGSLLELQGRRREITHIEQVLALPFGGPFPYVTQSNPALAGSMRYLSVVVHH